jgi:Ca2+-transporting ATPase
VDDARRRGNEFGPNELRERPRPAWWQLVFGQLNNFVVILLIAASLVSALLGDSIEAIVILAIVVLNAVLGVIQEHRAEQALAALKKMASPEALTIRGGHRVRVPARELVPGDVILLDAGNFVPADVRLFESVNLKIDESSLTGESVAVEKQAFAVLKADAPVGDRNNTAFMGTVVTYGRGKGVVVATGMQTQIGLIAEMIQSYEEEPTPLQHKLNELGKVLSTIALAICGLVFLVYLVRKTDLSLMFTDGVGAYLRTYQDSIVDVFLIAVSLAIAAVPEGLPAIVTISLALGMREMIKRHALIRKLSAVETLGSATTICSDKTGTLTQNEMTAIQLWTQHNVLEVEGRGYQPEGGVRQSGQAACVRDDRESFILLWAATLVNDAALEIAGTTEGRTTYRMVGDPTEGALLVAAAKAGLWKERMDRQYPRVAEIPFDSHRKRMSTVHALCEHKQDDGGRFMPANQGYVICVKGAPDLLLERCAQFLGSTGPRPLNAADGEAIREANRAMACRALRVLGVAYRPIEQIPARAEFTADNLERDLVFVGLIGMIDPARPEVKPAVARARQAGIRTVMITGDYPDTARAIAGEIGILRPEGKVLAGSELDLLNDAALSMSLEHTDVFARVSPQHKVRIVEAFRASNQVVAMTGDGVNDAPALKRADIGVAMGISGTDVTRETADMVLTDDNYVSIVNAVEQGRVIYANIRKFVFYLLSCNVAEIAIIFIAALAGWPTPLTAIQLLWLNLVTDGAPALALGLEKGDPDTMDVPPRPPKEPIVNRSMRIGILIQTLAITSVTLAAYLIGWCMEPHRIMLARTMAFITLSTSELIRAFTARSERYPLLKIGFLSNKYMLYAVGSSLLLLLAVVYVPFLREAFDTVPLRLSHWRVMLPLVCLPAIAAEVTKLVLR